MRNMNSKRRNARGNARRSALVKATALALAIATFASVQHDAAANPLSRNQVKRMYDRLAGTPPTPATINALEVQAETDLVGTAMSIMNNSSTFYSVTLKNFATPWTNRDQTVFAPLNDYT